MFSLKWQEDIQWKIPVGSWRNLNKSYHEKMIAFRFGFLRVISMEPNVEALWSDGLSEAEKCP